MNRRRFQGLVLAAVCGLALPTSVRAADDPEFFEKRIRPVLVEHCFKCHADQKTKGGLRLDSEAALLKGGDSGPALVPGDPAKSRLIEAVGYANTELQMPPKGKLPDAVLTDLAAWVKSGAKWPAGAAATAAPVKKEFDLAERKQSHWAWQPVRPSPPPAVKDAKWPRDGVDNFLLARLEAAGLRPAGPADAATLLRRLTFDLTGLPPTPAEAQAFARDGSAEAYTKAVDRLLASPHFGERWARHWLDLVRYAESRGHEFDPAIPNVHFYRDYVIRALNADLPYNQFVTEHIAGDLLEKPRLNPAEQFNESVLATGFWHLGEEVHSPVDIRQDQADRFDNRIDVFSKTFCAMTVACARCHDHKFDAISAKDYYALYGIIESSHYRLVRFDALEQNRRVAADLARLKAEGRPKLQKALGRATAPATAKLADYILAARTALLAKKDDVADAKPSAEPAEAYRARIAALAKDRGLDAGVLLEWTSAVQSAKTDPENPLHLFAKSCVPETADAAHLVALLRPFAEAKPLDRSEALKGSTIVVDYAASDPNWQTEEGAFGTQPAKQGDLLFSKDGVRFADRSAAVYDRNWDAVRCAPGSEVDTGGLGNPARAGRTLRTPSFSLTTGKVFYLVKGGCSIYAAVDAHTLIAGPLHGQLVNHFPAGHGYRWIGLDLTPYIGRRLHLEFTPDEGSDFALECVVQSQNQPPSPPEGWGPPLLASAGVDSLEKLANRYATVFTEAAAHLADAKAESTVDVRLADWLLRQNNLLAAADAATARNLAETCSVLTGAEAQLAAGLRRESRIAVALIDGDGVDESVFVRGSPKALGERAPRRFLEALAGPNPLPGTHGSNRLELANQMTDPAVNPLIARVYVNRIWHHLFGRGLVASVDNFGVLGERPSHPELLDYLADRFVQEGWSTKKLIRELVLSSAYQMSSHPDPEADRADPGDVLLHRARLRRLEGEAIRDAMLAASGRLDPRIGGRSIPIHLTAFLDGRGRPASGPLDGDGRRSLYLATRRNFLSPFLLAFDTPIPFSTVGRRSVSNVPAQALILLNDPFVHQQAGVWARAVLAQPGTPRERIAAMYWQAFGRPATESELTACLAFLEQQVQERHAAPEDPGVWADLAHTLFNVKEFIYLN